MSHGISQLQSPVRASIDYQEDAAQTLRRDEPFRATEPLPHTSRNTGPGKPSEKVIEQPQRHMTHSDSPISSGGPLEVVKDLPKEPSIPRKDPASWRKAIPSAPPPSSMGALPYEASSPTRHATGANEAQNSGRAKATSFSRPLGRTPGPTSVAEQVVEKAHSNSAKTDITETIAPGKFPATSEENRFDQNIFWLAVVHETIRREVHEVRQEVITREIHNHEYYHRILPIVDVEVLPARHFLPVEGGGLVEIGADEVPGRGRQWVIAETASKIRSDQPVPQAINRFSAREFAGSEGESKHYITPEGYERTEKTWVHPPELETGGRETGQTWPLVLGDEIDSKTHREPGSPNKR